MRRWLLLVGLIVAPGLAPAQSKPKVDVGRLRTRLLAQKYLTGKIVKISDAKDGKQLTLEYMYVSRTPRPQGQRAYYNAAVRYNQALARRNTSLAEIRKLRDAVKRARAGAFIVKETPILFQLRTGKSAAVRTMLPPVGPDGKPRRLTLAEQRKLRGTNPRLPGYIADYEDLSPERNVQVYIDKRRLKPGTSRTDPATVFPVSMIVIIPAPADPLEDLKPVPLR